MTTIEQIKSFLPRFVKSNDESDAILQAIADEIDVIRADGDGLTTFQDSGNPLVQKALDWKIYLSGNENDAEIIAILKKRYEIHEERGLLTGIAEDIERIAGSTPNFIVNSSEDVGWWLGLTYPGIDLDGNYNLADALTYLNTSEILVIELQNDNVSLTDTELQDRITETFIPVYVTPIYRMLESPNNMLALELEHLTEHIF